MSKKADILLKNLKVINVFTDSIETKDIAVKNGYIIGFGAYDAVETVDYNNMFAAPGLVDSHVHIESSMVSVTEFAKAVLKHGTTTIIADPHEIVNVLGIKGLEYMIESSFNQPVDIFFMVPSCVPATNMETAGAVLNADDIRPFFEKKEIKGLGEMMNYPGVIHEIPEVMSKIKACLDYGKVVDGHAPSISGKDLYAYTGAGISSDHECVNHKEALEKLSLGMRIMVREGTCARNLHDIFPAINQQTSHRMMWCTDDRHPHDLVNGHISEIIREAVNLGLDITTAVRMGSLSPCEYFRISNKGAIAPGMKADILIFKDPENFDPFVVYKSGKKVVENKKFTSQVVFPKSPETPHVMNITKNDLDFEIPAEKENINIIGVIPDQVVTDFLIEKALIKDNKAVSDVSRDILKLCVFERYSGKAKSGKAFAKGFGFKKGAIASSVAHDSHNILVCGTNDEDMKIAASEVIDLKGGFAVACEGKILASIALPIAGLMSEKSLDDVLKELDLVLDSASFIGSAFKDPFISLGFLSLPVIPSLKLTDHGLVDVTNFKEISSFAD